MNKEKHKIGAGLVKQVMKNHQALCRETFAARDGIRSLKVVRKAVNWKK